MVQDLDSSRECDHFKKMGGVFKDIWMKYTNAIESRVGPQCGLTTAIRERGTQNPTKGIRRKELRKKVMIDSPSSVQRGY